MVPTEQRQRNRQPSGLYPDLALPFLALFDFLPSRSLVGRDFSPAGSGVGGSSRHFSRQKRG